MTRQVKGGTSNPWTLRAKSLRANATPAGNRLPVISLVEFGGADPPTQKDVHPRRAGGSATSPDYPPTASAIALVPSAAPPPLMATGATTLGGATHARESGLADYLAVDEQDALHRPPHRRPAELAQEGPGPIAASIEPRYDAEELGIVPSDLKIPFNLRDVIARIVDDGDFDEFKPEYGNSLCTGGRGSIGIRSASSPTRRAAVSRPSRRRATQFIQLANRYVTPVAVLAQRPATWSVRVSTERGGIIKTRLDDDQRSLQLGAAHLARLLMKGQLRRWALWNVRPRLRPALPVRLAERQIGGHGRSPAGRCHLRSCRAQPPRPAAIVDEEADAGMRAP